ncbi:hypothetical protein KR200_008859 [Drosophila serrata]|nr:hypothetical protein KR200_008859 [Drosophila serrata]
MPNVAIPQVSVESTHLYNLRRGAIAPPGKSAPVSVPPVVSALPAVSTHQDFKKILEKAKIVEQKHNNPRPNSKLVPKEKQQQTKISMGVPSKATVSPRKLDSPKVIAFGRTLINPKILPNSRRKNPISEGNDFKVTKSAYKPTVSTIFSYDLSPLERNDYGLCHRNSMNPMKSVPPTEVQLLQSGQRSTYLEKRYELTPDVKYNYPEATSMRYGWFHRLGDPFQKRVPRKD